MSINDQPISAVQWLDPAELHANDYNPNHVFGPEMELLKTSILEDGWTQPIVVNPDTMEIIDGFHRWTLASTDGAIRKISEGKVPAVFTRPADGSHAKMSTIRHNRARGQHGIVAMGDIVRALLDSGMTEAELNDRLGMEKEEVHRLSDFRPSTERVGQESFGKGWVPKKEV